MTSYVVTGASRGLGYAWVTHLASKPSNTVVAIVRNKPATEARLAKDGITNIHVLTADVTDISAVQKAAAATAKITGGGLDFLIQNAGLVSTRSQYFTPTEMSPQDFELDSIESFRANVVGTAHVLSAFLPLVRKGSAKKIIVTSSGMADDALIVKLDIAVAAPYSISKAAVNTLVAKYHAAVGKSENILILAMCPGLVDTQEGTPSEEELQFQQRMGVKFAAMDPNFTGPIKPLESVEMQLEVIERATVEEFGGKFVSHHGDKNWL